MVVVLFLGEQVVPCVGEDEPGTEKTDEESDGGGEDPALSVEAFGRSADVIGEV
jgi:hypothetical protein